METKKNNIINKNKRSTQVVIVDKFEDNPQLEGKELQFHKKPAPTKPPGPNNPPIWFQAFEKRLDARLDKIESRLDKVENRLDNVEDVLKRNNLK